MRINEPLCFRFECPKCGFKCEICAPNGLEVPYIVCPECEERVSIGNNNR